MSKPKKTLMSPDGGREVCRQCDAYYSVLWLNDYEKPKHIPSFCPYCGHSPVWETSSNSQTPVSCTCQGFYIGGCKVHGPLTFHK